MTRWQKQPLKTLNGFLESKAKPPQDAGVFSFVFRATVFLWYFVSICKRCLIYTIKFFYKCQAFFNKKYFVVLDFASTFWAELVKNG